MKGSAWLAALLLVGCGGEGQGGFFYAPGGDDDDDLIVVDDDDADDDGDLRDWVGVEYLNLDYSEAAEADGAVDCRLAWDAVATRDREQADLCAACEAVWIVELTPRDGEPCGEFLPAPPDPYIRAFGVVMFDESEFNAFRTTWSAADPWGASAAEPLIRSGRGNLADGSFQWDASAGDTREIEDRGVVLSFSGEGAM